MHSAENSLGGVNMALGFLEAGGLLKSHAAFPGAQPSQLTCATDGTRQV